MVSVSVQEKNKKLHLPGMQFTDCASSRAPHFSVYKHSRLSRPHPPTRASFPPLRSLLFLILPTSLPANTITIYRQHPFNLQSSSTTNSALLPTCFSPHPLKPNNKMAPKKAEGASKPKTASTHASYQVCRVNFGTFSWESVIDKT